MNGACKWFQYPPVTIQSPESFKINNLVTCNVGLNPG